jgi:hypothetical protein
MWEKDAYRILVGKPEKLRHRWDDNTEIDLEEKGWESVDRINLARDRGKWQALVNTVMNR